MKKIKSYLAAFAISNIVIIPCIFLFGWICDKSNLDWFDVLFISGGISGLMICLYMCLGKWNKKAKITRIAKALTILATSSTILFCGHALLYWIFSTIAKSSFTTDWRSWIVQSVSLSVFFYIWDKFNRRALKNEKDLVVAVDCKEKNEAEAICTKLNDNGIGAVVIEKGSPMYINNDNDTSLQVQVMGKELQKAKQLIK